MMSKQTNGIQNNMNTMKPMVLFDFIFWRHLFKRQQCVTNVFHSILLFQKSDSSALICNQISASRDGKSPFNMHDRAYVCDEIRQNAQNIILFIRILRRLAQFLSLQFHEDFNLFILYEKCFMHKNQSFCLCAARQHKAVLLLFFH